MKSKRGSVEILILTIVIIIMMIILSAIFLLYIQLNSSIYNVKSDLFYIAQNAYLAANYNELAYSNYVLDENILSQKVEQLLRLNHPNYRILTNEIKYDNSNNKVVIDITLVVRPIVLNNFIGDIRLKIKENVKLKLMEVK